MDLLKRELAPILPAAWQAIDAIAAQVLELNLGGRKLVDFRGPLGWDTAAVNTGRLRLLERQPVEEVHVGLREVLPLMELRAPITLELLELDLLARGARDPDLTAVIRTAERVARTEDSAIFHGNAEAGIRGLLQDSPHRPRELGDLRAYPEVLLDCVEALRRAGVGGPYALALGTAAYDELLAARVDGYPLARQLQQEVVDGPLVHVPAIEGAVVLSVRGGDFELVVGQDLSIGYTIHDRDRVELYLTESFTFRVLEPAAAVVARRRAHAG